MLNNVISDKLARESESRGFKLYYMQIKSINCKSRRIAEIFKIPRPFFLEEKCPKVIREKFKKVIREIENSGNSSSGKVRA